MDPSPTQRFYTKELTRPYGPPPSGAAADRNVQRHQDFMLIPEGCSIIAQRFQQCLLCQYHQFEKGRPLTPTLSPSDGERGSLRFPEQTSGLGILHEATRIHQTFS